MRTLQDASRYDARLGGFAQSLESALIDVEDVASELRSYADEVEFDPESLEAMHARMSQLQGLLRAFGPRMEDVLGARRPGRSWRPPATAARPSVVPAGRCRGPRPFSPGARTRWTRPEPRRPPSLPGG